MLVYLRGTPIWQPENSLNISIGYVGDRLSELKKMHLHKHFSECLTSKRAETMINNFFFQQPWS